MLKAKAVISRQFKAAFPVADVELLHVIYPLKSLNALLHVDGSADRRETHHRCAETFPVRVVGLPEQDCSFCSLLSSVSITGLTVRAHAAWKTRVPSNPLVSLGAATGTGEQFGVV